MKTDSLFYSLFQAAPAILFELMGQPIADAQGYRFASEELKQTAFRLDGVFLPPSDRPDAPVYFLEVQMQRDGLLYRRLFSEVFLYLRQHPTVRRWRAVVVYPRAAVEVTEPETFGALMASPYVQVVYLDELGTIAELSLGLGILRLIVEPEATVPMAARGLLERVQQSSKADAETARLVELIETIVVYTFPQRSRQEVAAMLGLTDLVKDSRFYQETRAEALAEGRQEEAKSLVLRLLNRKLGELPNALQEQVSQLPLETLEVLGEALFDFEAVADLQAWLTEQSVSEDSDGSGAIASDND